MDFIDVPISNFLDFNPNPDKPELTIFNQWQMRFSETSIHNLQHVVKKTPARAYIAEFFKSLPSKDILRMLTLRIIADTKPMRITGIT